MLDSRFTVFLMINSIQYSSSSRKILLPLTSMWQIPMSMFQKWNKTIALYKSKYLQHFTACHSRQYLQYSLDIWQLKQQKSSISFLQLEAFPPITVHVKFSPSSILTMRNTVPNHNLIMYRIMMNQVPRIYKCDEPSPKNTQLD